MPPRSSVSLFRVLASLDKDVPLPVVFPLECTSETSILETRFNLKIGDPFAMNWSEPFSVDFSIWRSINTKTPQMLAESTTQGLEELFVGILVEDLYSNDVRVKNIGQDWTDFSVEILASLRAGASVEYVKELAEDLLFRHRNVHTATAIGLALSRWGFLPCQPWAAWELIKPDGNFAGSVQFMTQGHCIPFLNRMTMASLKIRALPRLGRERADTPGQTGGKKVEAKLHDLDFEMKEQLNIAWGNLGGRPGVVSKAQKRTFNEFLLNGKELPGTKRVAIETSASYPHFNKYQQHDNTEQTPPPSVAQCLGLTDGQCRKIQAILDPEDVRVQKDWESDHQPDLIRRYMTGESFPLIRDAISKSGLLYSHKTYFNRFREWRFPTNPKDRVSMIAQLYAQVTESAHSTGSSTFSLTPSHSKHTFAAPPE